MATTQGRIMKFTPTEEKIMALLSDGQEHTTDEMFAALGDKFLERTAVKQRVDLLRKKLRPVGNDVVCVVRHNMGYYQLRRLVSMDD